MRARMPTDRPCLLCANTRHRVVFREFEIDIFRCAGCGHVFSAFEGDPNYASYFGDGPIDPGETQFWWNDAHRAMYDAFCARYLAGKTGRLLDVGAGLGYFVQHASRVPGWEAHGSEMSKPAVDFAQKRLGLSTIRAGRLQDAGFAPGSFDAITLWDVVEHLADPAALLTHIRTLLRQNGFLFLHTPNVDVQLVKAKLKRALKGMRPGTHYLEAKDHLHLYSTKTLRRVLIKAGFARVRFVHLPPIQSVAGSRNPLLRFGKNGWSQTSALLDGLTLGAINLDNLFAHASLS